MVEPLQEPGILIFAGVTFVMIICAGVASLAPAQDIRVFLGATIQTGSWLLLLFVQKLTSNFAITSSLFIADILYLIAFFFLSRPAKGNQSDTVFERNWAGYVVAILAVMISIEMVHFMDQNEYFLEPVVRFFFYGLSILTLLGFLRGFGFLATIAFATYLAMIIYIGNNFYVKSSNYLSFIVILIILLQALLGVKKNFTHWFGQ